MNTYIVLSESGEPMGDHGIPDVVRQLEAIEEMADDVRRGIRTTDELLSAIERGL